ncbi:MULTISPECIES: hypothetical protein [unclassified Okeania]|uniref:hypothetical protein n=1 Tax=unclassified Okeania TaxID=2634635 RepID=UPI0013C04FDD|nr:MULTISPECIES: hypothetical protein [unclassified Okeania]NEN92463.1 hypothetical protein [Okeania sp. SIO3H1]NET29630.1 hypothetical protein [Okeania sp. SIO1I7]NET44518.1 hypothetical protein [Okeania sp. SIO2B3]
MLEEIFPFRLAIDATAIAGASLWSLALYWGFSPLSEWVRLQLNRWFNFAERALYTSEEEFEKTRKARESQNAFYASIFSIVPFLIVGSLCNWGVEIGLDKSWSISIGIIVCVTGAVYELGRRDSTSS